METERFEVSRTHRRGHCPLFLELGFLQRGLSSFRPRQLANQIAGFQLTIVRNNPTATLADQFDRSLESFSVGKHMGR